MRREFGLGDVEVSLFHSHSKKNMSKGRVNSGQGNSFNEGVEAMKMKNG